ncbi:MAG TPA: hypothetical protein VHF90_04565 [Thermoleophilaceae bacterium]|nr:hypothetical protein [Thermoleophilaceae bacterium]
MTLTVEAADAGGATNVEQVALNVDNTPPEPPSLVADGGENWRSTNDFTVRWADTEQHAPVVKNHYAICRIPAGACDLRTEEHTENAIQVDVPEPGAYGLRVWLEDAAGNVDAESTSPTTILKFDDGVPGRAYVEAPTGWLSESEAQDVSVSLGLESVTDEPVSGIAGYSVTTNGAQPDGSVDVFGRNPDLGLGGLREGVTVVNARAVSGSGVAATVMGSVSIMVDQSPPSVTSEGLPGPETWQLQPVIGEVISGDQSDLSGVTPASLGRPVEEGAHIKLQVADSVRAVRGHRAAVSIASDGHHTLTYRAFDTAGNGSVQKEAKFKIDQTAPTGAFRGLDRADPRGLKVDVADATSGIGDGRIEYRRVGAGGFERLETRRDVGVLSARVDDENLPVGRYELRAVVTDVAGNRAVIDNWTDGSPATVGMPLRDDAKIDVVGEAAGGRCVKVTTKRRSEMRGRKPAARKKCRRKVSSTSSLQLGHGKRGRSTGRLTTAHGLPVGGASIVVEGLPRSGGAFARLGTSRTDAQGRFRFAIPAGPSRTVRYRYDGTNTIQPAASQLVTKVRAAARLKVSRRRLRNGQVVRFAGRLLGKPIPSGGKVVALQAKVGRKWRTFATPRANARGVFKHRYRFTATTGLRRYAFRAVVTREAAYPYEAGVSRVVRVAVRGR